jgi:putative cell wall-binding protein
VGVGVIAALVATVGLGAASPAHALSAPTSVFVFPTPTRIQGVDRYDQAIKSSSVLRQSDLVYLASGEKFADALSTAAVAARHGAPLLLTPRDSVPETVISEITRLHATTVVVVGGAASVSEDAMARLSQRLAGVTVFRIGGADRYEVSRKLISDPVAGAARASTVFGATGANFPDALTASPAAAYAGRSPVMLMDGSKQVVSDAEIAVLNGLGAARVHVVGGPASLSEQLSGSLTDQGFTVTRSEGADRYDVGVNVNRSVFDAASVVYLASGIAFPDALSGGPLAARDAAPLYVVQPNCVPSAVLDDIARLQAKQIVILGGPNTLGPGVDALTRC